MMEETLVASDFAFRMVSVAFVLILLGIGAYLLLQSKGGKK